MRDKWLLVLVAVAGVGILLGALWWAKPPTLSPTGALTDQPIGASGLNSTKVATPVEASLPSRDSLAGGKNTSKAEKESEASPEVTEAIRQLTEKMRIVEEANTTLFNVVLKPESIAAVAIVTEPTVEQISALTSEIGLVLSQFDPEGVEYAALRKSLDSLYTDYAQFGSPKKVIAAMHNRKNGERTFLEFIGADENSLVYGEYGNLNITSDGVTAVSSKSSTRSRTDTRYEHLFTKALAEAEKSESVGGK